VDDFVQKLENNQIADPVDIYELRQENLKLKYKVE